MGMMIPQEGERGFLGNKEFLGNGGPETKEIKKGNAQPRRADLHFSSDRHLRGYVVC